MTAHRREGENSSSTIDPVEVAAAALLERELLVTEVPRRGRFFSSRSRRGQASPEAESQAVDLEEWLPASELRQETDEGADAVTQPSHEAQAAAAAVEELVNDLAELAPGLAPEEVRPPAEHTDGELDTRTEQVLLVGREVEDRARHVVATMNTVVDRLVGLEVLTTSAQTLADEATGTTRASLHVLAATEALAHETQESLRRRVATEEEALAAADARRQAEQRLAAAVRDQEAMAERLALAEEELARQQRERAEQEKSAGASVATLRAALQEAAEATAQAQRLRMDADRSSAAHKLDLTTAQTQLTQALNENELLSQNLTQALRSATAAADEAREAQGRRLQAELAVTVTAGAAREAQENAAKASEAGVRLQQQLEGQAAQLRSLLTEATSHLVDGRAVLEAHQTALTAAREQVLVQAQERIRAEACVAELLEAARPWRRLGVLPRLSFSARVENETHPAREKPRPEAHRSSINVTTDLGPDHAVPAVPTVADKLTVQQMSHRLLATAAGVGLALLAGACFVAGADVIVTGTIAGLAALALLLGRRLPRPAAIKIVGSVMHVRQDASSHVFDLADPGLRVETEGDARSRSWQARFHRRGLSPVVLSRRDVDPVQFALQLERWRGSSPS